MHSEEDGCARSACEILVDDGVFDEFASHNVLGGGIRKPGCNAAALKCVQVRCRICLGMEAMHHSNHHTCSVDSNAMRISDLHLAHSECMTHKALTLPVSQPLISCTTGCTASALAAPSNASSTNRGTANAGPLS